MKHPRTDGIDPSARSRARRRALQAVYAWQVSGSSMQKVLEEFRDEQDMDIADLAYFEDLLRGLDAHLAQVDEALAPHLDRPLDLVDPVVNLVTASNLELLFNTPKNTEDPDRFVPLVLVPKVVLKKNFSMNQASLNPRPGEEPCLTSQPVNGFRLMHQEFQDFIHNYYFLLTVSGLAVHLPYVVQPIT